MPMDDKKLLHLSKEAIAAMPEEARKAYFDAKTAHDKAEKAKWAEYRRVYNAKRRKQERVERDKERVSYWIERAKKEGYYDEK